MAIVNRVDKRVKMSKDEIIKYQILTYCFINNIQISISDLKCLTVLAKIESSELTEFCKLISGNGIFKSAQSCRNALSKCEKKGLIIKEGNNKKNIKLNSNMNLQTKGVILLDYKILSIETKES
tara:strand:+ start:2153 stop:2524 length:372 start_codon:yes stop_codon:yes gene_type:complete